MTKVEISGAGKGLSKGLTTFLHPFLHPFPHPFLHPFLHPFPHPFPHPFLHLFLHPIPTATAHTTFASESAAVESQADRAFRRCPQSRNHAITQLQAGRRAKRLGTSPVHLRAFVRLITRPLHPKMSPERRAVGSRSISGGARIDARECAPSSTLHRRLRPRDGRRHLPLNPDQTKVASPHAHDISTTRRTLLSSQTVLSWQRPKLGFSSVGASPLALGGDGGADG